MYVQMIDALSLLSNSTGLGDQGILVGYGLLTLLVTVLLGFAALKDDLVPRKWDYVVEAEAKDAPVFTPVFLGMDWQEWDTEPTLPPLPVIQVQGKTLLDKYLQPIKATVVVVEEYFETAILLPWEEEAVAEGYGSYGFVL